MLQALFQPQTKPMTEKKPTANAPAKASRNSSHFIAQPSLVSALPLAAFLVGGVAVRFASAGARFWLARPPL
jgi:hypothetical protein